MEDHKFCRGSNGDGPCARSGMSSTAELSCVISSLLNLNSFLEDQDKRGWSFDAALTSLFLKARCIIACLVHQRISPLFPYFLSFSSGQSFL